MRDLEEQVARVWNPDVRSLVEEAWRCYVGGANRASITVTWVAVCADLIEKISRFADDGDATAVTVRHKLERARTAGITPTGVRQMQEIERALVTTALELELVDTIAARELDRLREDRHLCAHPSLRGMGEVYDPPPETARAHLALALDSLLTHPPLQGRNAVAAFSAHVTDPLFVAAPQYLTQAFFDRVRPAARRRIVDLAMKHALLALEAPDPPGALLVADRMAACLMAFAARDRLIVRDALQKSLDRLRGLDSAGLLRAIGRLGDLDIMWTGLDEPLRQRLEALIGAMTAPDGYGALPDEQTAVFSLVCRPDARALLTNLEEQFLALPGRARAGVIARRIDPYFVTHLPQLLRDVPSWRSAEAFTAAAVLPQAPMMTESDLAAVLTAWAETHDCRTAGGMRAHAIELYRSTSHLHPADTGIWRSFIGMVRTHEAEPSVFRYEELEAKLPSG